MRASPVLKTHLCSSSRPQIPAFEIIDKYSPTETKASHTELHPLPPRSPPPQYHAKSTGTFRMRTSQPESTSPWTKRTLLALLITQIAYPVLMLIVNISLIVPNITRRFNYDNGNYNHLESLYFPGVIEACFTVVCLGMSIFQIVRYRRNRLMPLGMLIMSCLATMMWLVAAILNILNFAFSFVDDSGYNWDENDEPRSWAAARTLLVLNSLIL